MVEILRISPLKYRSFSIAVSSLSVPLYASRSSAGNFRSKSPYPLSAFEGSSSFLNLSYPLKFALRASEVIFDSEVHFVSKFRLTEKQGANLTSLRAKRGNFTVPDALHLNNFTFASAKTSLTEKEQTLKVFGSLSIVGVKKDSCL